MRDYFADTYANAVAKEADTLEWAPELEDYFDIDGNEVWRPPGGETEITRDYRGRPYIYPLKDGVPDLTKKNYTHTRVTTFIDCLDDKSNIRRWEWNLAMRFLSTPPGEVYLVEAAALNPEDVKYKSKMHAHVKDLLLAAGTKDEARRGNAVHAITERWDMGLDVNDIPTRYKAHLELYKQYTQYFEMIEIEKFTVHDELKTGGTPDRVVRYIPCNICGKDLFIEDFKTGRVDHYTLQSIGMQLALYAHSLIYNIQTGERTPMPDICMHKGIVIHIPQHEDDPEHNGGSVEWINIAKGWKNVFLAGAVREARKDKKDLGLPFTPRVNVWALLRAADSKSTLRKIYEVHKHQWAPTLDTLMEEMMEKLP